MKNAFLIVAAILLLAGCATTAPKISSTAAVDAPDQNPGEVSVIGVEQQTADFFATAVGVLGLDLSIKNTSAVPITVRWSKSSLDYGGTSHMIFLSGQKYADAGTPPPDRIVSAGSSISVAVFSADSPYYVSGRYGGWEMRAIMLEGELSVLICIESEGKEIFYSARAQIKREATDSK